MTSSQEGPRGTGALLRHGGWNLAGLILPAPVAIAVVPALIGGLGEARFGLLTFAWAIMGYFTMFDLGLGRATTREIAEKRSAGRLDALPSIVWSSLAAHGVLGAIGFVLFASIAAPIANVFDLDPPMAAEFRGALLWLAGSIPLLVVSGAFRGVLEGFGRFDLLNIIRIPSSIWTYVAPWMVVLWTPSLVTVMTVIVIGRALSLLALGMACVRTTPALRQPVSPSFETIRPMLVLGWWLTLGTIVLPLITAWDRFAIGAQVSPQAVGQYAAPYEVVTRLWVFSGALMAAAFPIFAEAWTSSPSRLGTLLRHATTMLIVAAVPSGAILIALAPLLLPLWLGTEFGGSSVRIAQWLAAGVTASVVAQAGLTFLQASGRADWVGRLQTLELIIYAVISWWVAERWGGLGVAMLWAGRGVLDCGILLVMADAVARSSGSPAFTRAQWFGLAAVPAASLSLVGWLAYSESPHPLQLLSIIGAPAIVIGWAWRSLIGRDVRADWRHLLPREPQ